MKKCVLLLMLLMPVALFSFEQQKITVRVYGIKDADSKNSFERYEIEISEEGETLVIANKKATETEEDVVSALLGLELPESNIKRNTNHSSHNNENVYFVRKAIDIDIPTEINKEDVFNAVIQAGASGYYERTHYKMLPEGDSTDKSEYPKNLEEAAVVAKKRAEEVAKAFNALVGKILLINDLNYGHYNDSNEFGIEVTYELIH